MTVPRPDRLPSGPPRLAPIERPEDGDGRPPPNLSKVLRHHPALQEAWSSFATHVLFGQTLPRRDRELAMLRIGWRNSATYEWLQHVRLATKAGVSGDEIAAIARGDRDGFAPHEVAVLDAVDELVDTSTISDATWTALAGHYSNEQVLDLIFTIGQYNLVSWFLNATRVPLDDGLG